MANCPARKPISDFPSGRSGTLNCPVRKPASPLGGQHALWPSCFTLCQEACFGPPLLEGLPRGPPSGTGLSQREGMPAAYSETGKGGSGPYFAADGESFSCCPSRSTCWFSTPKISACCFKARKQCAFKRIMYGAPLFRGTSA